MQLLGLGQNAALVTDSGTPLISDPGYKLVRDLIDQGIEVESIPGPSAVISALVVSGLPTDKFSFLDFCHALKAIVELCCRNMALWMPR